jgi:hypothetical protein
MNTDKNIIDSKFADPQPENETPNQAEKTNTKTASADPLKGAWKQVENIGQTLGEALQGRGNVVMVRVNNETLERLDMLVEAEIVKSRSEAAALLINEGAKSYADLFEKVREITDQIASLRSKLRETVQTENPAESQPSASEEA